MGAMHNIHIAAKALLLSVVAAAVGILIATMLTFATNNAPVALTQAERPYPPEPFALPATLITTTPEQCAVLPPYSIPAAVKICFVSGVARYVRNAFAASAEGALLMSAAP